MKKLVFKLFLKDWKLMTFLFVLSGSFSILIFFSDLLFGWNEKIVIQVSNENILRFQEVSQPFFDFQVLNSPNGTVQLLEEDSKWIIKNGSRLSGGLKKELMNLCMEINGFSFEDNEFYLKNHLLTLYTCLMLFLNGSILMMKSDVQCFHLKENLARRSEFLVLLCRLVFFDVAVFCMIGLCMAIRNSYDLGKGWLLCMRKYGLVGKLYNNFELFFYDHGTNIAVQIVLIMFFCILLALLIQRICQFTANRKAYALIFMGLLSILYLTYGFMIFQSHFPDMIEFMPFIGLIFVLKDICEGIYALGAVVFAAFIHILLILAL